MRTLPVIACAIALCGSLPAVAAPSAEQCTALAKAADAYGRAMNDLLDATKGRDMGPVANVTTGPLKSAVYKFEEARVKLIPPLSDMVSAAEDLAYQLKVCGRR